MVMSIHQRILRGKNECKQIYFTQTYKYQFTQEQTLQSNEINKIKDFNSSYCITFIEANCS